MSEFRLIYIDVERTLDLALGRENASVLTMSLALCIANSGRNEIYHFGLQTETENLSDIQPWAQSTVWTLLLIDTTQCAELQELRP
jgi:hypothetical protein